MTETTDQTLELFYTPGTDELLHSLGCSIALTTYTANKLIFISAPEKNEVIQLARDMDRPMGIAVFHDKIAIALKEDIVVFADTGADDVNNHIYKPIHACHTDEMDVHDLIWLKGVLVGVNTKFSALCTINRENKFVAFWKPSFITELKAEDRCHLNSIAVENDEIAYATAFSIDDKEKGWRFSKGKKGVCIDILKNRIICEDLYVPHSVRVYDGIVYTLLSATGELVTINKETGKYTVIKTFEGFVRGLARFGDYLFVGLSQRRETSSVLPDLPIAKKAVTAEIHIVDIKTMQTKGAFRYGVEIGEIYDIQVIPDKIKINISAYSPVQQD